MYLYTSMLMFTLTTLRIWYISHNCRIVLSTSNDGEFSADWTDYLSTHFKTLTHSLCVFSQSFKSISLLKMPANIYTVTDENLARRPVQVNNSVHEALVTNITSPIMFCLVWSDKCQICPKFKPIFASAASRITSNDIKFGMYQVRGTLITDLTKNSICETVTGVPAVLIFFNGVAVKNANYFNSVVEFLETIKTTVSNRNSLRVRMLSDSEIDSMKKPQKGVQKTSNEPSLNLGVVGGNTVNIAPGSGMNQCSLDDPFSKCFTIGEVGCAGGRCTLEGYEGPKSNQNGIPNDFKGPVNPRQMNL